MLSETQISAYRTKGFISGIRIMGTDEVAKYRGLFDQLEEKEGKQSILHGPELDKLRLNRHFDQEFVWKIATRPELLDCIEGIIGPNILLLQTYFFSKIGPDNSKVVWHQDSTRLGLENPEAENTAWFAFDDSDRENGCLQVVPGSQNFGPLEHNASSDKYATNKGVDVSSEDLKRIVHCVVKAGEVEIHNGITIHGSGANLTSRRRLGLQMGYIPTWTKPIPGKLDSMCKPILVRGVDRERNFQLSPTPFPF